MMAFMENDRRENMARLTRNDITLHFKVWNTENLSRTSSKENAANCEVNFISKYSKQKMIWNLTCDVGQNHY